MKTCLLVIDVQASFTKRAYFNDVDVPAFLAAQNKLITGAQAAGMPVPSQPGRRRQRPLRHGVGLGVCDGGLGRL
jgi:Isochorismatase family